MKAHFTIRNRQSSTATLFLLMAACAASTAVDLQAQSGSLADRLKAVQGGTAGNLALADASYQSTSRISGGTLVDTLKSIPLAAKAAQQMLAPTSTLTLVHGNRKAVVNQDSTEIVDLDAGTITHIDTAKKTYSVMTFDEMRQLMAKMPQRMEDAQAQVKQAQAQQPKTDLKTSFEVSAKNTGVTKVVNGLSAQEQVITLRMRVTDPNAPASAGPDAMTFEVTTDVWIAPDPPEVQAVHDFDMRTGQKMMAGIDMPAFANSFTAGGNAGMAQLLGGQPGSAEALAEMGKEMAKLQGTRVREVTSMSGGVPVAPQAGAAPATAASSGGSVVGDVATNTAAQTAAGEQSKMGVPGSALANSVFGALRKKQAAPKPAAAAAPAAPAARATPATASAVLMEMTKEETDFSREPVPLSVFEAPSGFTKVPSPLERMGK